MVIGNNITIYIHVNWTYL